MSHETQTMTLPQAQRVDDPFNRTAETSILGHCVHHLFEQAAQTYGTKTALLCGDRSLTFQQLNSHANVVARVLRERYALADGDLVAVSLERSVELVVVLMAVLKTGAAYMPMDPGLPPARANQMIQNACPKLLVASDENFSSDLVSTTDYSGPCHVTVKSLLDHLDQPGNSMDNLDIPVSRQSLAYVMYTSGSTGTPKGVEITHNSMSNLLLSLRKEPGCIPSDIWLAVTTISFDMAVPELFLPLLCGATTVIAQKHQVQDPSVLIQMMKQHGITTMQGTPTMWQMLLEAGMQGRYKLRKILCGGEILPRALADRLTSCGDEVWNMYGPTEATVYACRWKVTPGRDVLIGNPIANTQLYVLDENLRPVPAGKTGELYIGGAGVAREYRNRPVDAESSPCFLLNPFHGGMMYRTGDLARFWDTGKLGVMGRRDRQVKVRGCRVELGDVEAAIVENRGIASAAVVLRGDRLAAYCVRRAGDQVNGRDGFGEVGQLRQKEDLGEVLRPWLAERVPAYMVPAFFVDMEALPVSVNGKIDYKSLPLPWLVNEFRSGPPRHA